MTAADTARRGGGGRPLLGLRRRPGRLARWVFRLPLSAYEHGAGPAVGRTFLAFTHLGRRTGQPHRTVAMVLRHDEATGEAVVCAAWGPQTDWYRNLQAHPAVEVQLGGRTFPPQQRFLSDEEARDVAVRFRREHPHRLRLVSAVLGWGDLRDDAAVRAFVRGHPFVAFRAGEEAAGSAPASGRPGETEGSPTEASPTRADDVRQLAVSASVCSGLTALAFARPSAGRRVLGVSFALTGLLWNGLLTARAPEQYPVLARRAPWGWYRRAGLALTEPGPRAFGAAVIVGETALAAAVLGRDPAARLGLLGVTAFLLGTTPLGIYTLGNPILAVGALHLARRPWPTAAFRRRSR